MSAAAVFEFDLLVSPDPNLDVDFFLLFCWNTISNIRCSVFPWPA